MSLFSSLLRCPPASAPTSCDRHALRAGGLLRLDGAVEVGCLGGRVWITREGCAEDIVLAGNERRRMVRGTRVLAEALGDAVIEVRFAR